MLKKCLSIILVLFFPVFSVLAQPISGIWHGKMGNSKIELKLIRKGDSLIGTSYYYDSKTKYRRYSVKGYFDDKNNDVIWWDDSLIEQEGAQHFIGTGAGNDALLAIADFNCPGEGIMKLDGKTSLKNDEKKERKELHLMKGNNAAFFPDEWDFLIENYAYGVSHPEMMDSIEQFAFQTGEVQEKKIPATPTSVNDRPQAAISQRSTIQSEPLPNVPLFIPSAKQTNEERFKSRRKILQNVILVKGDSIELRFYDNAEIDGDSIAVFLNGKILKEHILLSDQAYTLKIAVQSLQADNELVMVAENLGTIPPNTSLMVALVDDKRYEAHLESSEGSSALVRLVKP